MSRYASYFPFPVDAGLASNMLAYPFISFPAAITKLNPTWQSWASGRCSGINLGVQDPPHALTRATALVPNTVQPTVAAGPDVQPTKATPAPRLTDPVWGLQTPSPTPNAGKGESTGVSAKNNPVKDVTSPNQHANPESNSHPQPVGGNDANEHGKAVQDPIAPVPANGGNLKGGINPNSDPHANGNPPSQNPPDSGGTTSPPTKIKNPADLSHNDMVNLHKALANTPTTPAAQPQAPGQADQGGGTGFSRAGINQQQGQPAAGHGSAGSGDAGAVPAEPNAPITLSPIDPAEGRGNSASRGENKGQPQSNSNENNKTGDAQGINGGNAPALAPAALGGNSQQQSGSSSESLQGNGVVTDTQPKKGAPSIADSINKAFGMPGVNHDNNSPSNSQPNAAPGQHPSHPSVITTIGGAAMTPIPISTSSHNGDGGAATPNEQPTNQRPRPGAVDQSQ